MESIDKATYPPNRAKKKKTPFFVSPELSSGRDLVIHLSVRRAVSGAFLGNRMSYFDDIWYMGGTRAEVAHAELWACHMVIKYLICIIFAKICPEHFSGTVCPTWMIFGMRVGLGPKVRMVIVFSLNILWGGDSKFSVSVGPRRCLRHFLRSNLTQKCI